MTNPINNKKNYKLTIMRKKKIKVKNKSKKLMDNIVITIQTINKTMKNTQI